MFLYRNLDGSIAFFSELPLSSSVDFEEISETEYQDIVKSMSITPFDYEKTQYQRDRKSEYDKLNQFELQYNDAINGTTTWQDAINEIKAKYPKPQ